MSGAVLVTGAAGFIGRATVSALRSSGSSFVATDRQGHSEIPDLIQGDLLDRDFVRRLLRQQSVSAVIHLAGTLPTAARLNPISATRVNIDASCALVEDARTAGVKQFVFGSSLGVYGGRFGSEPVSEDTPAAPEEIYGAGKLYIECAGALMQTAIFKFSALRIATTVGEGVTNSASPWRAEICEAARSTSPVAVEVPYAEHVVLPIVHVQDVGRMLATMATAEKGTSGTYNTPAESLSIAELQTLIARLNPNAKIKAGSRTHTGIPRYLDGQKLIRETGFQPASLHQHFESSREESAIASRRS